MTGAISAISTKLYTTMATMHRFASQYIIAEHMDCAEVISIAGNHNGLFKVQLGGLFSAFNRLCLRLNSLPTYIAIAAGL